MKRMLSVLLTLVTIFTFSNSVFAQEVENFDLIEYLENNEVDSYSEFIDVIRDNSPEVPMSTVLYSLTYVNDQNEEISFRYEIDYDNQLVEIDTVYLSVAAGTTTSGSAVHETYSSAGLLIFTVRVNGTFYRTTQSCSTQSKTGSFIPGHNSSWSSTPILSSGSFSSTKAYARIYGTASWLLQSKTYQLTLVCDNLGNLTSTYAGS